MILTLASHGVAFLLGAGTVFAYLHKHTAAAVNLSQQLAADANKAKAVIAAAKTAV
jgi:hypothetical protein